MADGATFKIEGLKELDAVLKELGAQIAGKIGHNGDPVMGWMMSNVVAKVDAMDGVYPRKERPENK